MIRLSNGAIVHENEIDSIYVANQYDTNLGRHERFIVSLICGYGEEDEVVSPQQAVAAALALTRDAGQSDTHWFVFDRKTGEKTFVEQGEVQALAEEMGG